MTQQSNASTEKTMRTDVIITILLGFMGLCVSLLMCYAAFKQANASDIQAKAAQEQTLAGACKIFCVNEKNRYNLFIQNGGHQGGLQSGQSRRSNAL